MAVATMIGKEDDPEGFVTVELVDYQRLKDIEDRISDVILCLDSTLDTLRTFVSMHKSHFASPAAEPQLLVKPRVDMLLYVLKEKTARSCLCSQESRSHVSEGSKHSCPSLSTSPHNLHRLTELDLRYPHYWSAKLATISISKCQLCRTLRRRRMKRMKSCVSLPRKVVATLQALGYSQS
jgi:hypothetical protein